MKRTFGNLLNPLGAYNKDHGTASQTLLARVRSHLQSRLLLCINDKIFPQIIKTKMG